MATHIRDIFNLDLGILKIESGSHRFQAPDPAKKDTRIWIQNYNKSIQYA